jgi:hypothetical protein
VGSVSALLSRYLKDFGEPATAIPAVETDDFANDFGGYADITAEPEVDVEAERQSAHAAGHAEATAALTEKYELEAQTVALVHQREIEELRDRYEVEAAELIATRLETIATEVAEIVSAATAKVLAPVMTDVSSGKGDAHARRQPSVSDTGRRRRHHYREGPHAALRRVEECTWREGSPSAPP